MIRSVMIALYDEIRKQCSYNLKKMHASTQNVYSLKFLQLHTESSQHITGPEAYPSSFSRPFCPRPPPPPPPSFFSLQPPPAIVLAPATIPPLALNTQPPPPQRTLKGKGRKSGSAYYTDEDSDTLSEPIGKVLSIHASK